MSMVVEVDKDIEAKLEVDIDTIDTEEVAQGALERLREAIRYHY
jgi:hypothetical protein